MPIAHCYFSAPVDKARLSRLVTDWSEQIQVDQKDITVNVFTGFLQYGQPYGVMVNLYLPTFWNGHDVQRIQLALLKVLAQHTGLDEKDIFIMTLQIQSGHVVENGQIAQWGPVR